jgi:hypothetical protein
MRNLASGSFMILGVLATTLLVAACNSDSTDPAVSALAGTYILRTINDTTLPYTEAATSSDTTFVVVADTLTIASDGTFLDVTYERDTPSSGTATFPISTLGGFIAVDGTTVQFVVDGSVAAIATVSGSTLTLDGNGLTSIYTK